ncbi:hypothetical protein VNO77_01831 [Canavalia gladiata]|uniref:HECT-type E3 ubiquitin transferase n=1 Tax=Canavalia gladiata TaxID=3824 RepID=A0AAN9MSL7_CANGL
MSITGIPSADHHRSSSKRKLDDDANLLNLVSVRMKKDVETRIVRVPEALGAAFRWRLQFFVRMMPKGNSMVMFGYPEEHVLSILARIECVTGIPVSEQRLIYMGKQLQLEQRLDECGIQKDSIVHLVGRLRSGWYPASFRVLNDIVSFIGYMSRGEKARDAMKFVNLLITKHFDLPGFLEVLVSSKIPAMLVTLYVSPYAGNKDRAECCIRHFLSCCRTSTRRASQGNCMDVVLEFCKLLRRVVSACDDPLYVYCRTTFAFLLNTLGVSYGLGNDKRRVFLPDILSFVRELADRLLTSLDSSIKAPDTNGPFSVDLCDLKSFLVPISTRIKQQQGLEGSSTYEKCHDDEDFLLAEEVDCLRLMFFRFLSKMDECLLGMEECLTDKEREGKDVVWPGWSRYLNVLKEMHQISKLFDDAEGKLWRVLMHHRSMLSLLIIQFAKRTDDHWWILENKSVADFKARRHFVMMLFPVVKDNYEDFHEMLIDRSQLLAESFMYIAQAKPESLRAGIYMEFKNEEASGPGVLREWFVLVCHAIFNPQNALFVACPNDHRRFYPNPASKVHRVHLEYFRFSGRIIALALMKKLQVGIVFDRVFFTQLAGNYVTLEDIRNADPYLYRSCEQILEMDADFIDSDALGLTFVREVEELGHRNVVELCPGGKNLVVNSKNREKFVDLLIQNRFVKSISEQVSYFAKGFADILSDYKIKQFFQSLELEDLDWMLYGSETNISVEDWKAHTKYDGYKETDRQISWFWEIVMRMSAERRKVLLFFWTSVKYLPVEGFCGLASQLYICRSMERNDRLPSSHTCFYQLCLPPYSSKAVMQSRLGIITQEHIGYSFGSMKQEFCKQLAVVLHHKFSFNITIIKELFSDHDVKDASLTLFLLKSNEMYKVNMIYSNLEKHSNTPHKLM